ncbi:MAG: prolyl oligopeptidase family serine peptidase [Pseudomonadota bacterium]
MASPLKIIALLVGVAVFGAALFLVGVRTGTNQLSTGVSSIDMIKVGARISSATAYTGPRVRPVWLPDGDKFVYNAAEKGDPNYVIVDAANAEERPFPFPENIDDQLVGLGVIDPENGALDEKIEGRYPPKKFSFVSKDIIEFVYKGRRLRYDRVTDEVSALTERSNSGVDPLITSVVTKSFPMVWPDQREQLSPDREFVLSLDTDSLHLRDRNSQKTQIKERGQEFLEWVLNDSKWSPDSRYIMVPSVNSENISKVPVVEWSRMQESVSYYPYPTVFGDLMEFGGVVFDTNTGASVELAFQSEAYTVPLSWLPDSSEILFSTLSRDATRISVFAVNPRDGSIRTILEETSDTYIVYPPNFVFRGGPDFLLSADGKEFLWVSEETGFRQAYLVNVETGERKQLTEHPFEVTTVDGFTADESVLYTARSNPDRPYDVHVHKVSLANGETTQLSVSDGQHSIEVYPGQNYYIDKFSTTQKPPIVELRRVDGTLIKTLSEGKRPLGAGLIAPVPEHFTALAADGETTIHGVIYKPSDFDPKKSYAVIDSIYGAGFVNNVPDRFDSPNPFFGRNFPEFGFVIVAVDARGTQGRGKAFKDLARQQFGQFEIADHVAAIKSAAAERPWMDVNRVGIVGHSYGGYFSIRGMLQAPDFYKVGVASGIPEMDYDTSSIATEAFIGLVDKDDDNLTRISNSAIIDQLDGNLMLVVQTSDVNTPAHGAFKIVNALTNAGKPYDMLLLPGANHAFRGSDSRRYFYERVGAYFQEHLGPPAKNDARE